MTAWPERLGIGDRVRLDGRAFTITGLAGRQLTLVDAFGAEVQADVGAVLVSTDFKVLDQGDPRVPVEQDWPSPAAREQALWWQRHIVEVMTGLPPGAPSDTRPRPEYDPALCTLGEREAAKAVELLAQGVHGASVRSLRRRRQRYQAEGIFGLVDGRAGRREEVGARWDYRVREALQVAVSELPDRRRFTVEGLRRRVAALVEQRHSVEGVALPSRSAFHRLYAEAVGAGLLEGRVFTYPGQRSSHWPGRYVVLDMVRLPSPLGAFGHQDLPEIVIAVDADSACVLTAAVHRDRRTLDGAALLARMAVPADVRAQWVGGHRLPDATLAPGEAPLIRPQTIGVAGMPASLRGFSQACTRLGVRIRQHMPRVTGREQHVDLLIACMADQLADLLGSGEGMALEDVQARVDEWVLRVWPHTRLGARAKEVAVPGAETPAQRYTALVAQAGWLATPWSPDAFADLLPRATRAISPMGITLHGCIYNSSELQQSWASPPSGIRAVAEVRWDPYDFQRVWLGTPDGRWLTVPLCTGRRPSSLPPSFYDRQFARFQRGETASASPSSSTRRLPTPVRASRQAATTRTWLPLQAPSSAALDAPRLAYHAQLPIHSGEVVAAAARVQELVLMNKHSTGARHGLLVHGAAATGKTTVLVESARWYNCLHPTGQGESPHRPVIQVSVPRSATPRMLLTELIRTAGVSVAAPSRVTIADLMWQARAALVASGTGLILVDEIDGRHLRAGADTSTARVLRELYDWLPVTFVFAGMDLGAADALSVWEQRRLMLVRLTGRSSKQAWHTTIAEAEAALRLRHHAAGTLPDLADHLYKITGGSIARLAYLVRSGAIRAIHDGTESLTREEFDALSGLWGSQAC
ncbi:TniB family NTP-binding protein [Streptomyces sp. cg36]|uniref:TniB family NTP-binding protein n=1 Tax=Streptomyces sp. cg36 TaxID=3238798 RepID=UPI0034E1A209